MEQHGSAIFWGDDQFVLPGCPGEYVISHRLRVIFVGGDVGTCGIHDLGGGCDAPEGFTLIGELEAFPCPCGSMGRAEIYDTGIVLPTPVCFDSFT